MAVKYWVATSNHGHIMDPKEMLGDFIQNDYWATDLKLKVKENKNVVSALNGIKVDDKIALSSFRNKYRTVHITVTGTITGIENAETGKFEVLWDIDPELYQGLIPAGTKNENWHQALFQLTTKENITLIFPEAVINTKVAAIAWNTLEWKLPSGATGKTKSAQTHEGQFGYGHEEWLFDTSKIIDGYHYGFLQPIQKAKTDHTNKTYPIWLYSIDESTGKRYWIGEIKRAIVIGESEADTIKQKYIAHKWLEEMENQAINSGSHQKGFSDYAGINLFNIKFKPQDLILNEVAILLPKDHPANKVVRYVLADFKETFIISPK